MPTIPVLDDEARANYLVKIEFPEAIIFQRPILGRLGDDPDKFLQEEKLRLKTEAYKKKLLSLPQAELHEKYSQEKAKQDKKLEKGMFFNHPDTGADFDYWSKMAHWSLDEAIALSFGKNPEMVNWEKLKSNYAYQSSTFGQEYSKLQELTTRALKWQKLFDPVLPTLFIQWATDNDIRIPEELAEKVKVRHGNAFNWKKMYEDLLEKNNKNVEKANLIIEAKNKEIMALESAKAEAKPMHTKEKETLLKMVIGMAVDVYGYKPDANRSPIPKEISDILTEKGLAIDPDTVRKWLREAAQLLPQNINKPEA